MTPEALLSIATYTGPTKKGVRFTWDRLADVIALTRLQAQRLGANEARQPRRPQPVTEYRDYFGGESDAVSPPGRALLRFREGGRWRRARRAGG
jgi:hypothetical protein